MKSVEAEIGREVKGWSVLVGLSGEWQSSHNADSIVNDIPARCGYSVFQTVEGT